MRTFLTTLVTTVFIATNLASEEVRPLAEPVSLTAAEIEKFDALFDELTSDSETNIFKEKGWPKTRLVWTGSSIPVCWENATTENELYRSTVRQAVLDTWEAHSAVRFSGWENCVVGNRGIRILIDDDGPHTKGLGTQLDKTSNGMVLNATYRNWNPSCRQRLSYCSYVIAVHEFGHALGFAHDHNRPDTPDHCNLPKAGSKGSPEALDWTPWDKKSVMNYCNPKWSNGGKLSKFDIYLVQRLYGKPI